MCTHGQGVFFCGSNSYPFSAGSLFLGVPEVDHKICLAGEEDMELFYLVFRVTKAEERASDFLNRAAVIAHGCDTLRTLAELLNGLHRECCPPAYTHLLTVFLLESVSRLNGNFSVPSEERLLVNYILAHLQEPIAICELSRILSMSQRAVYTYFHAHFGCSPAKYINELRISEAKGYLQMGFGIMQAAERVGFTDPSSFCRVFRRYTGMSPSDYLHQIQS